MDERREHVREHAWYDEVIVAALHETAFSPLRVALGLSIPEATPVTLDLVVSVAPHLLVLGDRGAGKTGLIHTILVQLVARHRARALRLAICDPWGAMGTHYDRLDNTIAPAAADVAESFERLDALMEELDRRRALFAAVGASSRRDFVARTSQRPPLLLVVIDDVEALLGDGDPDLVEACRERIECLLRRGRTLGVMVLVAAGPAGLPLLGALRGAFGHLLVLHQPNRACAAAASGRPRDEEPMMLARPGEALLIVPGRPGRQRLWLARLSYGDPEAVRRSKDSISIDALLRGL